MQIDGKPSMCNTALKIEGLMSMQKCNLGVCFYLLRFSASTSLSFSYSRFPCYPVVSSQFRFDT